LRFLFKDELFMLKDWGFSQVKKNLQVSQPKSINLGEETQPLLTRFQIAKENAKISIFKIIVAKILGFISFQLLIVIW